MPETPTAAAIRVAIEERLAICDSPRARALMQEPCTEHGDIRHLLTALDAALALVHDEAEARAAAERLLQAAEAEAKSIQRQAAVQVETYRKRLVAAEKALARIATFGNHLGPSDEAVIARAAIEAFPDRSPS